jgi:tetratricopeptide (TPR) repeat protein
MRIQVPEAQNRPSLHPQTRSELTRSGFISLLAWLWLGIKLMWGVLISSEVVLNSLLMVLKADLMANKIVTALGLGIGLSVTIASGLAHHRVQQCQHDQRQAFEDAMVIAVHHLLAKEQREEASPSTPPPSLNPTPGPAPPSVPPLFVIPSPRNPLFTGREDLLTLLHTRLTTSRKAALTQAVAISGLGGIGKTQIAREYAYRYQSSYQAVLWITAANRETLVADFVNVAHRLALPERDMEDPSLIVAAVRRWLEEQSDWLLILDNADDLDLLSDVLPTGKHGALLLTTQAQATGSIAPGLSVSQMNEEEGCQLLLCRAQMLSPADPLDQITPEIYAQAAAIVREMAGLPLALGQAGAYIEETRCGLDRYLERYCSHRRELLQRRGTSLLDHPAPVATTLRLSFDKIEHMNPTAANLLRLYAFLAPDALPEAIVSDGVKVLGKEFETIATDGFHLDEAIGVLCNYSLIQRDPGTRTLSIHRLVQAVLQDTMPPDISKQWKERAVHVVHATFPNLHASQWTACEQWFPHALICIHWIAQEDLRLPVVPRLFWQIGCYLKERAQYVQAATFFHQALALDEEIYGPDHLEVAKDLNDLAYLLWNQGKYEETEPLFQRALTIRRQHVGHENPVTAETLQNLACLYQTQGHHEESMRWFQAAVAIDEDHAEPAVTTDWSNQADLFRRLGRYKEAEILLERACARHEQLAGQDTLDIAHLLQKQGLVAYEQGKQEAAESFFKRALDRYVQWLGIDHPNTAQILNALADVARIQGRDEEAESLFQHALAIKERQFGEMHSSTAATLNGLALLYLRQGEQQGKWIYVKQGHSLQAGKLCIAEGLFERALEIRRQVLGEDHPNTALLWNNLACCYQAQGATEEAEPLFLRALVINEKHLGREHPGSIRICLNLLYCYGVQEKYEEAQPLLERVKEMDDSLCKHAYPTAQWLRRDLAPLLESLNKREP